MSDPKDIYEPIKHVNGLGEVMWQPAIKGWAELRYGKTGEHWTDNRRYGEPVLYIFKSTARRKATKKAAAKARHTWERVE